MIVALIGSLAAAGPAGSWENTFTSEGERPVPAQVQRTVLVLGQEAQNAGLALCRVLDSSQQRCALEVMPDRLRRNTDTWIASSADGLVYVVRSVPESAGVTVSVFHGSGNRIDWYAAQPHLRAVSRNDVDALHMRVGRLEEIVETWGGLPSGAPEQSTEGAVDPEEAERAANTLLAEAVEAANVPDAERAWLALRTLSSEFSATRANQQADRIRRELGVLGRSGLAIDGTPWFVAPDEPIDVRAPTLLVFFEVWCPHSQAAMPELQARLQDEALAGWQVAALTQQTRGVDRDQVTAFIREHGLTFAVGRDTSGGQAKHYTVRGVPAAVALVDGKVQWRGHPSHITTALLTQLGSAQ